MFPSSAVKHRRRASLVLLSWLVMSLFSCAALSNIDAAVDGQYFTDISVSSHHSMAGMDVGEHDDMPCCEQQLTPVCCDDVIVVHSSYFNGADTLEKSQWLSVASLPAAAYDCVLNPSAPAGVVASLSQGTVASYPRLHLVHCSFLD